MENELQWIRRVDLPGAPWEWRMDRTIDGTVWRAADIVDAHRKDEAMQAQAQTWAVALLDAVTNPQAATDAGCSWLRAYPLRGE